MHVPFELFEVSAVLYSWLGVSFHILTWFFLPFLLNRSLQNLEQKGILSLLLFTIFSFCQPQQKTLSSAFIIFHNIWKTSFASSSCHLHCFEIFIFYVFLGKGSNLSTFLPISLHWAINIQIPEDIDICMLAHSYTYKITRTVKPGP